MNPVTHKMEPVCLWHAAVVKLSLAPSKKMKMFHPEVPEDLTPVPVKLLFTV